MSKPSLGVLHRMAPAHRASTPEVVATSLVALHSTDPASVHLAVAARTVGAGASVADVDRALHEDRTIVRVMGMRRTMWAVPADLVPVVAAACGRAIATDERRKLVKAVEDQAIATDGLRFVADLEEQTLAALANRGQALTTELASDVAALKGTVRYGGNSKWAADVGLSSRIVLLLTCDGRIVRTRPGGKWTSTRHRYSLAPPAEEPMQTADAQAELARRWLSAFGPLSMEMVGDLKWWAGWTVAATKRALAAAGAVPPSDPVDAGPWAALVPSLDPTTMGWKGRSWYLGELGPQLFDRNGNAGPAIWWCERIVGGWAQRSTGEVVTKLLLDIGGDGASTVEAEAARLQDWLDASGAIVKPRFPTPLHKELVS
ncbi:MAG: winged helix DNA-binding domain-containing protein [Actinomycetota bacterium]|nr:winged helix DNA-binding domain-containing protein [Actinomycetota bacterium]MDQ3640031.1 winged helix DNA-binding domain-containing protein [Actinomycetota bacterium]